MKARISESGKLLYLNMKPKDKTKLVWHLGTHELALASPSTTEIHALVYALTEGEREIASKREGEREGEREREWVRSYFLRIPTISVSRVPIWFGHSLLFAKNIIKNLFNEQSSDNRTHCSAIFSLFLLLLLLLQFHRFNNNSWHTVLRSISCDERSFVWRNVVCVTNRHYIDSSIKSVAKNYSSDTKIVSVDFSQFFLFPPNFCPGCVFAFLKAEKENRRLTERETDKLNALLHQRKWKCVW